MKVILLAAGKSTRLKPLTNKNPKVMMKIGRKPVLEYNLDIVRKTKIKDVYINLHYAPEKITSYFGDGSKFGVNITYSKEKNILGSAGAIKRIGKEFKKTFFVIYGDNFTNCDLDKLLQAHKKNKGIVTIAIFDKTKNKNSAIGGGRVIYNKKTLKIKDFKEGGKDKTPFINSGIYVLEPEIFRYIPKNKFYDFGKNLFPSLLKRGINIYAYLMPQNEYLFGIDTPECYKKTKDFWAKGKKIK